ncbi:MarR family transcriptional regulator [Streptomyces sp. D2-8]|uniref:MarR family winged helix-turn-helix transcriptional regulator n=1 Tax=Streptomyces sp. D2-8 TaxID=2707767 RepID=UPI0020C0A6FE|nr:MarR family transcriptional regulator [Streptomyces sp. D2-8]MCK8438910.1 MarR family transcriptional regulator [Streptomyces sp. D2-8]
MSLTAVSPFLGRLIGPLRRAVLLRTRRAEDLPDLPEAQIELLRVLSDAGTLAPREVATRLRVASSTVSNLVRAMTASGLVERKPSPTDLRTTLVASPRALDLLDRYDRVSTETLRPALTALAPDSRQAIEEALPTLTELIPALEAARLTPGFCLRGTRGATVGTARGRAAPTSPGVAALPVQRQANTPACGYHASPA